MKQLILNYIASHKDCSMLEICDGLGIYMTDCHFYLQELKKEKLIKLIWIPPFKTGYQII
jgi:hypothetical protein